MFNSSTLAPEKISVRECRFLLDIQSRDTINEYLKTLDLFGIRELSWQQFRRVVELQTFLGLKHGCNSKDDFKKLNSSELSAMFSAHGIDIESKISALRNPNKGIHRVAVDLILDAD
ncbi:MAG TPA: hypothetical protein VE956_00080 [Nodularia sp. (in: cyanobacteria)]|nr:hypothetical protein [Nodularia sp. (in: cyanobacteria)]